MPSYTAEQLDLSRLPAFELVKVDAKAEEAALKAGIVARYAARGIPYNVQSLETDFGMIAAEEFAYRKTLDLQALNDAGHSLSLTYGSGAALDQMAATYFADIVVDNLPLRRAALVDDPRPYVYGTDSAADWESDERFKLRIGLAPQYRTPGTLGGYEYVALTAAPWLQDAIALNYASGLCRPGQILVILLGRDPDPNPDTAIPAQEEPAQILLAQAALRNRVNMLGSDEILSRPARRVNLVRSYALGVPPGPDPSLVKALAAQRYAEFTAASERRIGALFAASAEVARLMVGGVKYAHPTGATTSADVDPGLDGVVAVTRLDLTLETSRG